MDQPQPALSQDIDSSYSINESRKWWVLLAICVGTFMTALDTSVVNAVLPVIRQAFNSNIAAIEWVVIIYLLTVSGLLLSFGRLGDLRGHRPIYLSGFLIFIISSVLCGLSQSTLMLVGLRGLQAIGAAMLSANSPAILTKSFPGSQRGQALGLQATMTYLGLTLGPSLGGWLTDLISWRAVFLINLPVGLLALGLSIKFIPHDLPGEHKEKFDYWGALVFTIGLIFLLLGLNQGHAWGWTSPAILSLVFGSVTLIAVFIWIESRVSSPMVDLSLFHSKIFSASTVSAVINYICVYSVLFLMPFYLIQGRGLTASQAGLFLSTMSLVMAVIAPISGTFSDRVGTRIPALIGMVFLTIGLYLLSRLGEQTADRYLIYAMSVTGLGIGIFISPNTSALLGAAPLSHRGIASGILATARNVGMVLGVGFSGAIFTTVLAKYPPSFSPGLFQAIQYSFLAAACVAFLGILTTSIRGTDRKQINLLQDDRVIRNQKRN